MRRCCTSITAAATATASASKRRNRSVFIGVFYLADCKAKASYRCKSAVCARWLPSADRRVVAQVRKDSTPSVSATHLHPYGLCQFGADVSKLIADSGCYGAHGSYRRHGDQRRDQRVLNQVLS